MKKYLKNNKGFTLIELMVVIVILGLLVSVVAPRVIGRVEQAKRNTAAVQIKDFEGALKMYYLDNGFYPSSEQGLSALIEKPSLGAEAKNWREGGYLEKKQIPKDPWGHDYVYLSPGVHNEDIDLFSPGADGLPGGTKKNSDINNWELETHDEG